MWNEVYNDKKIVCVECGQEFIFSVGEQKYYEALVTDGKMKMYTEPKRCKKCRIEKKKRNQNVTHRDMKDIRKF